MSIEILVLLHATAPAISALPGKVTAALPPRLLVLQIDAAELPALQRHTAVAQVVVERAQAAQLQAEPALNEAEALFASAYAARGAKSGPRLGQGMDWGSPGLTPPGGNKR